MSPKPPSFEEAVRLFNQRQFFECHEVLEDLWRPLPPGPEKTFLQGFLQIAVGFHHLQKHNYIGAKNKLKEGLEKLDLIKNQCYKPFPSLSLFCDECDQVLEQILELGKEHLKEFPQSQLPQLNIFQ